MNSGPQGARGSIDAILRRRWGWMPYRLLGGATIVSCVFVLLCDVVMWFLVEGYNPLAQTISELAAGPYHQLQDTGIVVFVTGILALTIGLILRGKGSTIGWIARIAFLLLAVDVATIALWNEYGDGDAGGPVIHKYLVMTLYVLVGLCLWLGTAAAHASERPMETASRLTAITWMIIAPFFYLIPEGFNGAYERLLALIMIAAVATAAWVLYRRQE